MTVKNDGAGGKSNLSGEELFASPWRRKKPIAGMNLENMLEIRNLHARIADDGTEIIRGLNLTVQAGEVAAIMGPNGSGKSTLSYVLAGRDDYEVTEGDILYNGHSILEMDPAERAAAGIFLAFPVSDGNTGRRDDGISQGRDECAAQGA